MYVLRAPLPPDEDAPRERRRACPRILAPILSLLVLAATDAALAAPLSNPAVDAFNLRVGTQTFAPKYLFTTNTALVETAEAIRTLGSDVVKFHLGRGVTTQYGIRLSAVITNLATLARDEPSCRRVLDLPFRHYLLWTYCFTATSDAWWKDGFSADERRREYDEVHALARHLLTQYDGTGKSFYLGHWEGDWYLLPNYDTSVNPSPTAIQGMIDWLNVRQQAVDDALRDTPHTNVHVYTYTEANRVRDAMVNGPSSNRRLVNTVLPSVTNLDFVSWSSYDGQNLGESDLRATLDYLEAHLPPAKAATIAGRRVIIGEYGWGGTHTSAAQEPLTRAYLRRLLRWSPRFILFWEIYDNEGKAFWLIDRTGARTPCHQLHQQFLAQGRLEVARFHEAHGRLPDDTEFSALVSPLLAQPLSPRPALEWSAPRATVVEPTRAELESTLSQGIYGADAAEVIVSWGRADAGTNAAAWERSRSLGFCTRFQPTPFAATLTNLVPRTSYFFRFRAVQPDADVWSPATGTFTTPTAPPPLEPKVGLVPAGDRQLKLIWPANGAGFAPFTTLDLRPPILWSPVTNPPDRVDEEWQLTLAPADAAARFFQLRLVE